jgi:SAM-dependent methyltransferase
MPDSSGHSDKAALRGEPSYVWRAGQDRRLAMIVQAAGDRVKGDILEDGCGLGMYMQHLAEFGGRVFGLDYELERVKEAHPRSPLTLCAAGEHLPYPSNAFDLVLSNEVIEHVQNDRWTVAEIVRVLKPGGRLALFCPNRGYPFETHGIYWRGEYHFGNKFFVNYLPRVWRDRLAPHVRIYSRGDLEKLFAGQPVKIIRRTQIFGAYDNIIARHPGAGKVIRAVLHTLEGTPLRIFGLSHFWVVEKTTG